MAHQVKLLGLLGLLLGACTALPPDKTEALGPVFNEDAKQGYVALAGSTWDAGDWDFIHFDRKAEQAMLGDEVWPDRVASRLMPASARETMLVERARLVDALEASARRQSPREAAKAQVSFDCWLDEVGASGRADLSDRLQGNVHGGAGQGGGQAARRARHVCGVLRDRQRAAERAGAQHDHRCGPRGAAARRAAGRRGRLRRSVRLGARTTRRWRTSARSRWSRGCCRPMCRPK